MIQIHRGSVTIDKTVVRQIAELVTWLSSSVLKALAPLTERDVGIAIINGCVIKAKSPLGFP